MYYMVLESITNELAYQNMKNVMMMELGPTKAYSELFAHITGDVFEKLHRHEELQVHRLEADMEPNLLTQFAFKLIRDNAPEYQKQLAQKAVKCNLLDRL